MQCLFFSLIYLIAGIWAIRKNSMKWLMVSGFFFSVALLTKAFAVFMLIPLGLYYAVFNHKKRHKIRAVLGFLLFFLPASLFVLLWYQYISGLGILKFFLHDDFFSFNDTCFPSVFFVGNYLLANVGIFFLAASTLSIILAFTHRKQFAKFLSADLICLVTIVAIAGFNTLLAVGFNLKVPYVNPIKYGFQFLPLLCLLSASLAPKFSIIFNAQRMKRERYSHSLMIAVLGLTFLIIAICSYMSIVSSFSMMTVVPFHVEGEVSYSVYNLAAIKPSDSIVIGQLCGLGLITSGILWLIKNQVNTYRKKWQILARRIVFSKSAS